MDPVSVYKEDDKPFTTIWFARSVCGKVFHKPEDAALDIL